MSNEKAEPEAETSVDAATSRGWKSVVMESLELVQCGDNFISQVECVGCGCCWNPRRLPVCYHSYGQQLITL